MVSTHREVMIEGEGLVSLDKTASRLLALAGNYPVWLFDGAMGAGKTTLIKAICRQLGVDDNVTSPTFSLVNEYVADSGPVYHFDFYRVKDLEEALQAGVEEYFYSGSYCFIEWPEIITDILPERHVKIGIEVGAGEARKYKLVFYDNI